MLNWIFTQLLATNLSFMQVNNPPTIDTTNPIMSSLCPFAKLASAGAACPVKSSSDNKTTINHTDDDDDDNEKTGNANTDPRVVPPKCPFGYDSNTFKLGPLSCMVCHALLHQSSKCTPCSHKFCKCVVSYFNTSFLLVIPSVCQ